MKKNWFKKLLITGLISIQLVGVGTIPAMAATVHVEVEESIAPSESRERADVLITYWRTVNDVLQYRIWNATRGRWMNEWTVF